MTRIFIGVAWPYSNGPFHLGQLAGAYLPADIFARFHRLRGDEVLMVSGSDMHGTPTSLAADREGVDPAEIANRNHAINRNAFERLGVSFDLFTSTHTVQHERTVQEFFLQLLENGYLDRRTEENPFCPKDQRFLADRYLSGECPYCHNPKARGDECDNCGRYLQPRQLIRPVCALCGTPVEFRESEHFYLLLDKLAPALAQYVEDKSYWRPNVLGTTRNFLTNGLRPTPITRDIDWGVPLPLEGYDAKRFYVWFEAVIGYLSASKEWAIRSGRAEAWKKYWGPGEPVRHYYFIGKDNVFFHTLVWPGMLIGHGDLPLPYDVPANEWMQVSGGKISKSRPESLDAFAPALLARYPPDVIRFYAALLAPQNHDTQLDWDEFKQVREDILSNQYGNLVQRLLVFCRDRFHGEVPEPPDDWDTGAPDGAGARIRNAHERITRELDAVHLKEALDLILTEVRELNRRFQEARPWQADDRSRRATVYEGVWWLKAIATWLSPYLPFSSAEVFAMLGFSEPPGHGGWEAALAPVPAHQRLGEVRPLFPKEEEPVAASASPPASSDIIPLALRAAQIESVEPHPSADKLYVLRLNVGSAGPRTVVAGIRPFYSSSELVGRSIVLLSNLEPRTIRRMTSQGMLLAADVGDRALLLTPPVESAPGTLLDGVEESARVIRYDEFERAKLEVGQVVDRRDAFLKVSLGGREVDVNGHADVGELVVVRNGGTAGEVPAILTMSHGARIHPDPATPPGSRVR